jgi:hypothetical protein
MVIMSGLKINEIKIFVSIIKTNRLMMLSKGEERGQSITTVPCNDLMYIM